MRGPQDPERPAPVDPDPPAEKGDVSAGSDGRLPPQHASSGGFAQHDRDEDPPVPGLPAVLRRPQLLHVPGHHVPEPGRHGRVVSGEQELLGAVLGARLPAALLLRHPARNKRHPQPALRVAPRGHGGRVLRLLLGGAPVRSVPVQQPQPAAASRTVLQPRGRGGGGGPVPEAPGGPPGQDADLLARSDAEPPLEGRPLLLLPP